MLKTKNLTKAFTPETGIFNIDLEIKTGEIVGFLGPNGAGKTTFMSSVLGFTQRDSGEIEILGEQTADFVDLNKFSDKTGFLLAEQPFPGFKTSNRILSEIYEWRKSTGHPSERFYDWKEMASEFKLNLEKKFSQLSLGNKRKVAIISALMHKPELIVMDEPTSGLDPILQRTFSKYLRELANSGSGIILSSHVLSEVENICDRIIMIKNGKINFKGNTKTLLKDSQKRFRIELVNIDPSKLKVIQKDSFWKSISDLKISKNETTNELILMTKERKKVLDLLHNKEIYEFYVEQPSLEELFIDQYTD